VDLAVVGVVGALLSVAAGGEYTALLGVVTVGWGLFYYFVSESTWGQTLGKRWLGLRVERAAGGTPDEREIALRTVLRVVDGIGFYVVGLVVMLRTGERRQRLGDIVAGTAVVDAREPSTPGEQSTLNTMDAAPVSTEAHAGAPTPEVEPHRAELPSHLFTHDHDEEPVTAAEPDDAPRVEIVSQGEYDFAAEEAPEPELPVAEADVETPAAEPPLPKPEPEPEPEPESEEDPAGETMPFSSPALEELAGDVASSASRPARRRGTTAEPVAAEDSEAAAEPPAKGEPITVKPVETVSPMDLVMGEAEDAPEEAGKSPRNRAGTPGSAA
jgi:uncharacterized RDD family membrane protein YckC